MFTALFGDIENDDDDKAGKVLATRTNDNKNNKNNEQREAEPPFLLLHFNLPACITTTAGLLPMFFQHGGKLNMGVMLV